jgi:hypothetical protein
LGPCLAGLDPNSDDFAVLPPHFTVGNPMENPLICKAIELMYGWALSKWVDTRDFDPTALLCKVLPLKVYHLEFLKEMIRRIPGHPFSGILLLNNTALLLLDQKALVTLNASPQVLTPTGILPHIHHTKLTTSCLNLCQTTLTELQKMSLDVRKAVSDAIKAKALENGIVTMQTLAEMFTAHHERMDLLITTRLAAIQTTAPPEAAVQVNGVNDDNLELAHGVDNKDDEEPTIGTPTQIVHRSYAHSGHFWHTPPRLLCHPENNWTLAGWKIWCTGIMCYQSIAMNKETNKETPQAALIQSFRDFKSNMLPKDI